MNYWLTSSDRLVLAAMLLLVATAFFFPFARHLVVDTFISSEVDLDNLSSITLENAEVIEPEVLPARPRTVDPNTAPARKLKTLDGIGPVLSNRIISYREAQGKFSCAKDLLAVKGVGSGLLAKIKPRLVITEDCSG